MAPLVTCVLRARHAACARVSRRNFMQPHISATRGLLSARHAFALTPSHTAALTPQTPARLLWRAEVVLPRCDRAPGRMSSVLGGAHIRRELFRRRFCNALTGISHQRHSAACDDINKERRASLPGVVLRRAISSLRLRTAWLRKGRATGAGANERRTVASGGDEQKAAAAAKARRHDAMATAQRGRILALALH